MISLSVEGSLVAPVHLLISEFHDYTPSPSEKMLGGEPDGPQDAKGSLCAHFKQQFHKNSLRTSDLRFQFSPRLGQFLERDSGRKKLAGVQYNPAQFQKTVLTNFLGRMK